MPAATTKPPAPYSRILDNYFGGKVHQRLDADLRGADVFRAVSAYFSIYGYGLLEGALKSVGETRFLFGEPSSASDVDPGAAEGKAFAFDEGGLSPSHALTQKALAARCKEWAEGGGVEIRSVSESNFLHGKMYLTERGGSGAGIVGSSNFTQRGLGGGGAPNIEINLAADEAALSELVRWFDRLWADESLTKDAKREVLDALDRIGKDYSPEAVYYKTLFELFREEMDAMASPDADIAASGVSDSQIWRALYEFQKDGARSVISKLNRHNGCILADSVGLGKTYTALAAIKYFESRNQRVLVLCPKKLMGNWSLYQAANGHRDNPFPDDRFGYALLAHTDLSRDRGMSGGIDLATFNWSGFDAVVIDESHNFRNDGGKRYQKLLDEVVKGGARTKVLMLSATPVNTSLIDLRNQIYLMTEKRENAFRESLGVGEIRLIMDDAQTRFQIWESGLSRRAVRDKAALMDNLGADFLRLLDGVSISRSRRQIERFYAGDVESVGRFPEREKPRNLYPPTDTLGELSYDAVAARINGLALSIYLPANYLAGATPRQIQVAANLVGMIRTNFLKRLESSPRSLALTLSRVIEKMGKMLERIRRYRERSQLVAPGSPGMGLMPGMLFETRPSDDETIGEDATPYDDDDDEDYSVSQSETPFLFGDLDLERWEADIAADRDALQTILDIVVKVTPDRDGKLLKIKKIIREKAANPTVDRDCKPNRKTLLFTTFKDTAEYLYKNLRPLAEELGVGVAMVSGDLTRASAGDADFNSILSNFAPRARGRKDGGGADIDLLIATDCISEGQNLQDCDFVINYDVHWNPVRIIQRFGRIDRIGGRNDSVRMVNCWPTKDMEKYLDLQNRVRARMALADIAATGGDDPLDEGAATREIQFRNEQLMRLQKEAIALEDLDDVPTLGDFTLGQFLAQLLRYLERNREYLENMPRGSYAVANPKLAAEPGVIFCLEQRNAAEAGARTKTVSPKHPYYLVYMRADGSVAVGCASVHRTLAAFAAAADGEAEPILALCDAFDRQTARGTDMAFYNGLLKAAVADIRERHGAAQFENLLTASDRDFKLTAETNAPKGVGDFNLITWLVIMGGDKG